MRKEAGVSGNPAGPLNRGRMCIALVLLILMTSEGGLAYDTFNGIREYDEYFCYYTEKFFGPDFDWRYFKAQAIAESNLKPRAVSSEGAIGLMQILPTTFREIAGRNPEIRGSIEHPRWNIAAGIYYDKVLWEKWIADRPFQDRLKFMFGSYNAGLFPILKAQRIALKRGLNPTAWQTIERILPHVLGSHVTVHYVRKIPVILEVLK